MNIKYPFMAIVGEEKLKKALIFTYVFLYSCFSSVAFNEINHVSFI